MRVILQTLLFILIATPLFAQGISRSTGLGFRGGLWISSNPESGIHVQSTSIVEVSAPSGYGTIYLFSRLKDNWYLETSIGGIAESITISNNFDGENINSTSIIPFLLGCRYDILSSKFISSINPYLSFGGGMYWFSESSINNSFYLTNVGTKAKVRAGVYGGGGIYYVISNWCALNFDTKFNIIPNVHNQNHSGLEFGLGFCFMWGKKREIFQVKEVKIIVRDIYPAYYQFYNTYPLALVSIKNTASFPIEVNIISEIKNFSAKSSQTGYIQINSGEIQQIPVKAVFGRDLINTTHQEAAVLNLEIEAKSGVNRTKSLSEQVIIHTRNSWNGEIDKLAYYITPDQVEIRNLCRKSLTAISDMQSKDLHAFTRAKFLFNELNKLGIQYESDPHIPYYQDDRVQFPLETINLKTGDCDDLVILYSSLLEGIGINTAFIDVKDPQKELAHLYMMFDTGLPPEKGYLLCSNKKRYVIRQNHYGKNTIWIPVETTLIDYNFEEAWKQGALQYLQQAILRKGDIRGWVQVIDVK